LDAALARRIGAARTRRTDDLSSERILSLITVVRAVTSVERIAANGLRARLSSASVAVPAPWKTPGKLLLATDILHIVRGSVMPGRRGVEDCPRFCAAPAGRVPCFCTDLATV